MSQETIKFGLMLTIMPFTVIFLCITIAWALVDLSYRNVSIHRRVFWALAVILLPLAGPIAYNYLLRRTTEFTKTDHLVPCLETAGELCDARE
ncbi:MAG TPA: PLD nuclease N-terminal domain-containing protein [Desulfuromonadaceae bacterium]